MKKIIINGKCCTIAEALNLYTFTDDNGNKIVDVESIAYFMGEVDQTAFNTVISEMFKRALSCTEILEVFLSNASADLIINDEDLEV